ncbi:MAG TPA: dolichyl-phosphate beta-glucosyltransferase [Verrucomicrobiae bacterium]|nr:dolichyl-phosphate beta-glucosyltransferase [Verrucomicrobiae bacterium]
MNGPRYSIVIPAYNEAARIEHALVSTRAYFDSTGEDYELIVVDDGSTDGTTDHVKNLASVVKHEINQGKGAAIRSGALAASGEWLLFLDADLSTKPEAFDEFLPFLSSHDVLFGSRRAPDARIRTAQPAWRNGSGQIFNFLVRRIVGLPYRDTQCGFKAFRLAACRPLFEAQQSRGWAFDVELLARARGAGLLLREIPVEWHHAEGSRVRLSHAPAILSELLRIRAISHP